MGEFGSCAAVAGMRRAVSRLLHASCPGHAPAPPPAAASLRGLKPCDAAPQRRRPTRHPWCPLQPATPGRIPQGTGGMATKLTAARIATAAGCRMAICNARDPRNIVNIINGDRVGTVFYPLSCPLR